MNKCKRLKLSRNLLADVSLLLFAALYYLMMHGMRKDIIPPSSYRFAETVRLLCCAVLLPLLIFGLNLALKKKAKTECVFLLLFIPLSLLMMGAMPVSRAPDELAHLQRAYLISEGYIFPSSEPVSYPQNFFDWDNSDNTLRLTQLAQQKDTVFSEEKTVAMSNMATGIYPANSYFPQALGMAIARLFTSNRIVILYAARFGAWLATLFLLYHAIRLAPDESKHILLMISLFPMTLQEAISASADGMTIGVIACMTAFVLRTRQEKRLLRRWDMAEIALLAFCAVTFKVMYLPFLFMLLLIPQACFGGEKKRRVILTLTIAGALAVILAWCFMCKVSFIDANPSSLGGNILPQLAFVIQHPLRFALIMLRTLSQYFGVYCMDAFGICLSWFNLPMPSLLIYMFMLLFISTFLKSMQQETKTYQDNAVQVMTLVLCAATVLVIFLFLYAWWTAYQAEYIDGIQGRYFIPILFPALAAAQYGRSCSKELSIHVHRTMKWIAVMDIFVIMTVLIYTI